MEYDGGVRFCPVREVPCPRTRRPRRRPSCPPRPWRPGPRTWRNWPRACGPCSPSARPSGGPWPTLRACWARCRARTAGSWPSCRGRPTPTAPAPAWAGGLVAGRGAGCPVRLCEGAPGPCRRGGHHRRDGLPEAGHALGGGGAPVCGDGGAHRPRPGGGLSGLRRAPGPHAGGPGTLPARGLDRRPGPAAGGGAGARHALRDQAAASTSGRPSIWTATCRSLRADTTSASRARRPRWRAWWRAWSASASGITHSWPTTACPVAHAHDGMGTCTHRSA